MRSSRLFGWLGLLTLTSATAFSQPPGTPASAAVPAPFRTFIAFDGRYPKDDPRNRQEKMHCLVCENGLAPVIAVFAKNVPAAADAPLEKLLKAIQPLIPKYRGDRFASYVVFLRTEAGTKEVVVKQADGTDKKLTVDKEYPDDDRTKEEGTGPKSKIRFLRETEAESVQSFATAVATPQIPFGLAATKSKMTEAFGIGEDPEAITVIVYNRLLIAKRWTLKPDELTDEKIKEIVAAAEESITGLSK